MPDFHISPKAPLMFRDGRPFGTSDNIADTLVFPLPSTIAGAIRTAWAESQNNFDYHSNAEKLLKKQVLGPILTSSRNGDTGLLFPAPADSLCLKVEENDSKRIYRLRPLEINNKEEGVDLPKDALLPVFLDTGSEKNKSKPANDPPHFWHQQKMVDWLANDTSNELEAETQGVSTLPIEIRTHVAIEPKTQTSKDAHLYQTAGLDFSSQRIRQNDDAEHKGWTDNEFGLLVNFQDDFPDSYRTIGGEARLGHIEKKEDLWPEQCPAPLVQAFIKTKGFRLILATPAIFDNGWLPNWLDKKTLQGTFGNLKVQLRAASIPRWQAGTSWDMTKSRGGKGMRTAHRLVPAGSVYWFEILSGSPAELSERWLTSISDCRDNDGFGLVLPGIWSMQTKSKETL